MSRNGARVAHILIVFGIVLGSEGLIGKDIEDFLVLYNHQRVIIMRR
jgi:hypothetical protein